MELTLSTSGVKTKFMTKNKTVAIACDHGGVALRDAIIAAFPDFEWVDFGAQETKTDQEDYPDYANKVAEYLREHDDAMGVLICGSGIGMSMAANRHKHIRCAVCTDETTARLSRQHNDANVIALGERLIGHITAIQCVSVFLQTDFQTKDRYIRRIEKMS